MMPVQLGSVPFSPVYGGWRPSPQQAPTYSPRTLGQAQWRPQLGQAASVSKGADVLFSLLAGAGAMVVGLAAMTVGIGGDPKAVPAKPSSASWKWVGGFTALAGVLTILINVSKISRFTEMAALPSTTPTSQPR